MREQKQTQKQLEELKRAIIQSQQAITRASAIMFLIMGEEKEGGCVQDELDERNGTENKKEIDKKIGEGEQYRVEKYPNGEEVMEGVFDGIQMIGYDSTVFPVPENYASKSKLVEGDRLKLTITPQGRFVYKQIGPVPRETRRGILAHDPKHNEYRVLVGENEYKVLKASVTYYKGEAGDEAAVVVPKDGQVRWAAIDNIVKELPYHDSETKMAQDDPIVEQTHTGISVVRAGLEEI